VRLDLADNCVHSAAEDGVIGTNLWVTVANTCNDWRRVKIIISGAAPNSDCLSLAPGKWERWHFLGAFLKFDHIEKC
jgi:hypothetical protein